MKWDLKWRMTGFLAGIVAMIALVAWSVHTAWGLIGHSEERFITVEQESFHFADRFQQSLQRLNTLMLRYQISRQPADWAEFMQTSRFLSNWVAAKRQGLPSDEERRIQRELEPLFESYQATADLLHAQLSSVTDVGQITETNRQLEGQSQKMFIKASELSNAHRQAQQRLVAEFSTSLSKLYVVLVVALIAMVASVSGMAVIVFREMIAPMQIKLRQNQELLERQEKLASLGVLAAGVAHEIRNPLTAIKARIFTLSKGLKSSPRELADAQVIDQEINRLERIVKDFLLFARPSEPALEVLPAMKPLQEIEVLMRPQIEKAGVQLVLEPGPAASIRVDQHQIKQVLMNLVQNAAEAVGENGCITLRWGTALATLGGRTQPVVMLEVADNGKGIPPETQKRLFDPFFSTKEAGTGLGLSIAARLLEKQGGHLHFTTEPGKGTTFSIILPNAENA